MVVTDLHGDRPAFDCCLERFSKLYWQGDAQHLIFTGDVIHGYGPADTDDSLNMILDIIDLRERLGEKTVLMLLGNHEMPHIYGISLSKGSLEFTSRFEHRLNSYRDEVVEFFASLPLYIRTAAGVMISHAGPAPDVAGSADMLRWFDHAAILAKADQTLAQAENLPSLYRQFEQLHGIPYEEMARHFLAVKGPHDRRYPHLLRAFLIGQQDAQFELLWNALFTQNEAGKAPAAYQRGCQRFLSAFSVDAPVEQTTVVSGHISTPEGGYTLVNKYHLRVASAAHAIPRDAGQFLLLDCTTPVRGALDLVKHLHDVFTCD